MSQIANESNKTTCRFCGRIHERMLVGKFNGKDKKFRGSCGRLWNGLRCPECVVLKAKENMRKKRDNND